MACIHQFFFEEEAEGNGSFMTPRGFGRRTMFAYFCFFPPIGDLRISVNFLQNGFSAFSSFFSSASAAADVSPPQDGRKEKTFTVSYLVESLGFTGKLAESISRKASSEGKGDSDSVLNLLTSNGLTDSQISDIVRAYPRLFILDAEKLLAPKLQFLQSRGASTFELTEILSKFPHILGMRWQKAISRYYDFIKEIVEADKSSKFEKLSHSLPQGSQQENIIRNVLALREIGVPQKLLFSLLVSSFQTVSGKERFEESLKKFVGLGFDPTTPKFVQALRVVYQMSEKTIEEKLQVHERLGFAVGDVWEIFKKNPSFLALSEKNILNSMETFLSLGFTRDEFTMMVKRYPPCIGLSAETVKKKTEFVVEKMNWSLKALVLFPPVFGYSLEKRIVPRCNVIKALMSKGLLGSKLPPLPSVLAITNEAFVLKYVKKHDDKELVLELLAIFTRGRVS
ncbi:transcription termination factor MTERF4, chloroplastic-like [Eutrema salsugineum]|uniref:transcription termination factor MTERF4, chloroplastic-like n=1 Tax=Eutrema salsugineum TaxID=72664 RepID=UPI000CED3279|nr:transcription termination factor MTERF4, chloroplastic-like [Eutrema salsugineum]